MADLIVVVVILAVFFVATLVGFRVYNAMSGEEFWTKTQAGSTAKESVQRTFTIADYGAAMLLVGAMLAMIISAFFIKTHPVFFVFSFIILIIIVAIMPILSNAFMEFATSDQFSTEAESMTISTRTVGNFPILVVVFGCILLIVLYAKWGGGGA